MRVLVTGSTGLLGKHLCDVLESENHTVYRCDKAADEGKRSRLPYDLLDKDAVKTIADIIAPEAVFHLASHAYEGLSAFIPRRVAESVYISTLNALAGAINGGECRHFVITSSMARYGAGMDRSGFAAGPPFDEVLHQAAPVDVYGVSKVAAEWSVRILCDMHDIPWTVIVPHNVYGPGSVNALRDPYRGVILIWINAALRGKPILVYGDGSHVRAPSYISDFTDAFATCLGNARCYGRVINLGSSDAHSIADLAKCTADTVSSVSHRDPVPVQFVEKRPLEVPSAWCTTDLSQSLLGYRDNCPFKDGVRRTAEWAYSLYPNGVEPQYLSTYEITAGMPTVWRECQY